MNYELGSKQFRCVGGIYVGSTSNIETLKLAKGDNFLIQPSYFKFIPNTLTLYLSLAIVNDGRWGL